MVQILPFSLMELGKSPETFKEICRIDAFFCRIEFISGFTDSIFATFEDVFAVNRIFSNSFIFKRLRFILYHYKWNYKQRWDEIFSDFFIFLKILESKCRKISNLRDENFSGIFSPDLFYSIWRITYFYYRNSQNITSADLFPSEKLHKSHNIF